MNLYDIRLMSNPNDDWEVMVKEKLQYFDLKKLKFFSTINMIVIYFNGIKKSW
ncbi:hypothetical protein J2T03_001650 [Chryseobacterium lathyri]|nr:hypothetical protein [Chryseobacterium lathyri]